ncbi:MAG TPA: disulfide bond formation protein B [Burkholderiales bacterium]|jgi:disulfide bond formation protein DsbB|nr:disulfide bond formation protein B [Burkholderiales bacterium]
MSSSNFNSRIGYGVGFLVCLALIGFAYYLQFVEYQEPCPLCILQRLAFFALGAVFLVATLHGPGRAGSAVYSGVLFVIAGIGAAIATRHVWLQHLPKGQVPECGPGLEYMLKKFALGQALEKILSGSGECAETGWTFLGLSIAGWSLLWFVLLAVFAVILVRFSRQRAAR